MMYEVELKFRVDDWSGALEKIQGLGGTIHDPVRQSDQYYNHPDRGDSEEALRIRQVGEHSWITFKGPRVDSTTKTREELDIDLSKIPGVAGEIEKLFTNLGYRRLAVVRKERFHAELIIEGRRCKVAFDVVDGLGRFVELETMAEPADYEPAKACLDALAENLGLFEGERRSYLELIQQHISA